MRRRHYSAPLVETIHEIPDHLVPLADPRAILLLEDDATLAEVLRNALEKKNFRITRVRNGIDGIQKILESDYHLILCDMIMPGFPGDMFYRAVERSRPHLCNRFLFMTGHTGDRQIDVFIRGVRGLMIFKPFQLHELLEAMDVVLKKTPQLAIDSSLGPAPVASRSMGRH
jgi:DNA-binding response OmpR family regulator